MEQFKSFDITILGGGHAGLEAAWAANQFNLSVAIVTMPGVGLGSAPCNPAVGGVGKGQVVREIDAMGGLMGRLADLAGIANERWNVSYHPWSMSRVIKRLGFSRQKARPAHPKTDEVAQAAFKGARRTAA